MIEVPLIIDVCIVRATRNQVPTELRTIYWLYGNKNLIVLKRNVRERVRLVGARPRVGRAC